jgi:hypothetical protein
MGLLLTPDMTKKKFFFEVFHADFEKRNHFRKMALKGFSRNDLKNLNKL